MASSPVWKVYRTDGEYIASVKHPSYAAMILTGLGEQGATIRWGHGKIVWVEGVDGCSSESYDYVAEVCQRKAQSIMHSWVEKQMGVPFNDPGQAEIDLRDADVSRKI